MKKLRISRGYTIVDDDTFDVLKQFSWARHGAGYVHNATHGLMHRFIMNAKIGEVVDHVNGDKLDNRRENLRVCTQSQNLQNRKGPQNNSRSKILGVFWCNTHKKWVAKLKLNGRNIFLGYHHKLEDAVKARREGELKYFGDYAPKS